jgi:hypothetical protein
VRRWPLFPYLEMFAIAVSFAKIHDAFCPLAIPGDIDFQIGLPGEGPPDTGFEIGQYGAAAVFRKDLITVFESAFVGWGTWHHLFNTQEPSFLH